MNDTVIFSKKDNKRTDDVTCELSGRLGNHMFQLAHLLIYADRHHLRPVLDKAWVFETTFPNVMKHISVDSRGVYPKWYVLRRHDPVLQWYKAAAKPHVWTRHANVIWLAGRFQSHMYFLTYEDAVRRLFQPSLSINDRARQRIQQHRLDAPVGSVLCSVHVRLTDYGNCWPRTRIGQLGSRYYTNALKKMTDLCRPAHVRFLIFTDDPTHCRKLSWSAFNCFDTVMASDERSIDPSDDMFAMSACDTHILANATYAWWAAWLNTRPSRIVVMPSVWFASPLMIDPTLAMKGWHRVTSDAYLSWPFAINHLLVLVFLMMCIYGLVCVRKRFIRLFHSRVLSSVEGHIP